MNEEPHYGPTDATAKLMERLTALMNEARENGRGLVALDLIAARDATEMLDHLLGAIHAHHFDTQHIHDKGVYPHIRLADRMLYEAAGLPPIV